MCTGTSIHFDNVVCFIKMNVSLKCTIKEHASMCAVVNQNNWVCDYGYQPIKEK